MKKLYSDQISVTILPPATSYHPVDGRKYTLIFSNKIPSCHLAIGYKYQIGVLNAENENMVTAEWKPRLGEYILTGKVYFTVLDQNEASIKEQFTILLADLAKAIEIIVKADQAIYTHAPWLLDAPIYIEVDSNIKQYQTIQYYGTPRQHLIKHSSS